MTGTLLSVDELTVSYGGVTALDDVSLTVDEGAIVGLIGPNGAGKTTFIDTLTGFTAAQQGHITFAGDSLDGTAPHVRARLGLVRTFQSLELFDDLTVRENLQVSATTPSWRSTFTDLFWHKRPDDDGADEILAALELTDCADELPIALSNGQRHLVALARALVARPKLVLLDEPAAGLDTAESAELATLLRRIPALGSTVLLVDHDMGLVLGICDAVHVLDFGRLIASGSPAEIRNDPEVIAAYLGHEHATTWTR